MIRTRSAGFVITLEFLLVMAIFVVPLVIGLTLLARKFYTAYEDRREAVEMPYSRSAVFDSSVPATVIGPVIGYDQFEAPLIIFRDFATKSGVILGVRRNRFTSYGEVYYAGAGCAGTAYVRRWDVNVGTGPGYAFPPIGFAYQMQGVSYAMGEPNILYSSTLTNGVNGGTISIGSVWRSEDFTPPPSNVPAPPCFTVNGALVDDLVVATPVINFDAGASVHPGVPVNSSPYVKPYQLAFPTPTAGPALPCPTGEC